LTILSCYSFTPKSIKKQPFS